MAVTSRTRRTRAKAVNPLTQGKITVPMGDYDPDDDRSYGGDQPTPGNYTFKLAAVEHHVAESSGNASIHWRFAISDKKSPFHGWPYGDMYTNLDPDGSLFKTQQIMYALTGQTKDLSLDLSDTPAGEKWRQKFIDSAPLVRGSVRLEPYQDQERAKLGRVMPMTAVEADDDEDDYDDDFEDAEEIEEEVDEEEEVEEDEDELDEDEDEDEEEEDVDEDDEEEEEPEPAPRRRAAAKKAAPTARRAAATTRAAKKAAPAARRARR